MTSYTGMFGLPRIEDIDAVSDYAALATELADRLDYMLGEGGEDSVTIVAANTKTTKVINFGRTYTTPPRVVLTIGGDAYLANPAIGSHIFWVEDVSTTGFTVGCTSTAVTPRPFTWHAKPKRTDATPIF